MVSKLILCWSLRCVCIGSLFAGSIRAGEPAPVVKEAAKITSSSIAGKWSGFYVQPVEYPKKRFLQADGIEMGSKKVSFYMTLSILTKDGAFEGFTTESDIRPSELASGKILRAKVVGRRSGDSIAFVKTYETLPGAIHYEGKMDPDAKGMSGTWTREGLSDRFEAVKMD